MSDCLYENEPVMRAMVAALSAAKQPGDMIIYRGAFRWRGEDGGFLSNHYECQSAAYLCQEHGYELVHDLNHIAVIRLAATEKTK